MGQVYDFKLYTAIGTTKVCEILYLHVLVQFQNKLLLLLKKNILQWTDPIIRAEFKFSSISGSFTFFNS